MTLERLPGYSPRIDVPRTTDLESLPLYQEIEVPDAKAFFRISPVWLNHDPDILLKERGGLVVDRIAMEHGAEYWLAHQGMEVLRYKKTPGSPTWYYARSIETMGVHTCLQEVSSEKESIPHHHKARNEQLITLYGACIVRVGEVEYLSTPNHPAIDFPIGSVHSVRSAGGYAINALVIRGPGDCSSQDDHFHQEK